MTVAKQVRPFHNVLVANRGEIALRIMRTVRRLGYGAVAVYSEADCDSPHVGAADRAVCIGGAAPRDSYLNIEAILAAAQRAGADAIHPGYGFLAENADFAAAVDAAGLVFIGPSANAISAMGNKAQAKRLLLAADMPCIPGYHGESQDDTAFTAAAQDIGYPVMVKAAAGGGGRGMRLVHEAAQLGAALGSARSEALQAFGSGELILERAVLQPRHVEIQVLADSHGHCIHLGERDCSVQRRHQKLIEEAPSPGVDARLRERMGAAAVRAAQAIGYIGAGTMEFLLDREGRFYFMEMNTRLQVEHAVTEAITGLDLVAWQLRIAAGEPLTLQQHDVQLQGHAIEVRLTAEDVAGGFLPQTGAVLHWQPPPAADFDVRIDHGLAAPGVVSPYYDSMLAKLVAHGATRDEARRKLIAALRHCVLLGLPTNQAFLVDCLADPVFADGGDVHTGFVDERFGAGLAQRRLPDTRTLAFAALAVLADRMPAHETLAPAASLGIVTLGSAGQRWQVRAELSRQAWQLAIQQEGSGEPARRLVLREPRHDGAARSAEIDGMREAIVASVAGDAVHLFHAGEAWSFERVAPHRSRQDAQADGTITAPLTGRIVDVAVAAGEHVEAGQRLVVLEAMKMEHTVLAPMSGRAADVRVAVGGQAGKGELLLRIEAEA